MRTKRLLKYKKNRHRKARRMLLMTVIMPLMLLLIGYLVASLIILPSIPK